MLPVLGMNAVKILKAELESLRYEEVEKNYYDDDGFGKPDTYVKIPHDKIYRLSSIPCGFDAATNVLLNDLASHLAHAQSKDHFDPVEFCYEADEQLGEMAQFQLSVCDMLGLKWEASRLASSIEKVYSRKRGMVCSQRHGRLRLEPTLAWVGAWQSRPSLQGNSPCNVPHTLRVALPRRRRDAS